ncbi:uncharacterized protein C8orf58 homolog isoform X1 [Cygnus olor]|uniref:uncharacterized protein C8orf58 homolog isoform X1 n=1 Tax=Cygnus olor TaxID=8869 RepID=UPI001ADE4E12|nr:uncharacterized protein C8orf58 homolog isoform X1 [Cygnus olor]XP_040394215.1 uncharacterized protein C8orf58 homolog isoform X1 [Cygnus olor]
MWGGSRAVWKRRCSCCEWSLGDGGELRGAHVRQRLPSAAREPPEPPGGDERRGIGRLGPPAAPASPGQPPGERAAPQVGVGGLRGGDGEQRELALHPAGLREQLLPRRLPASPRGPPRRAPREGNVVLSPPGPSAAARPAGSRGSSAAGGSGSSAGAAPALGTPGSSAPRSPKQPGPRWRRQCRGRGCGTWSTSARCWSAWRGCSRTTGCSGSKRRAPGAPAPCPAGSRIRPRGGASGSGRARAPTAMRQPPTPHRAGGDGCTPPAPPACWTPPRAGRAPRPQTRTGARTGGASRCCSPAWPGAPCGAAAAGRARDPPHTHTPRPPG